MAESSEPDPSTHDLSVQAQEMTISSDSPSVPPSSTTTTKKEELLSRHKKELRDLQSRITQKKKQATKKTRRGVNDDCERMEREVKERQTRELRELEGWPPAGEGVGPDVAYAVLRDVEAPEASEEDDEGKTTTTTLVNGESKDSPKSSPPTPPTPSGQQQQKKPSRQKARLARRAAEVTAATEAAEAEASTLPDHRALERTRMSSLITSLGLEEIDIRSDGHCMYSAVAHSLSASPSTAAPSAETYTYVSVREKTARFISSHPDDYSAFLEEDLGDYVHKIKDTAEWGGELELNAISRWSGRRIRVVQGEGVTRDIDPEEGGKGEERGMIWLAYYRKSFGLGEHYNALKKKA